jgi:hypothetical protein
MNRRFPLFREWLYLMLMAAAPLLVAAQAQGERPAEGEAPGAREAEVRPPAVEPPPEESASSEETASETPRVIYPEDRPEWVEAPVSREGEIDRIAVVSGPHYSLGEARRQLDEAVQRAVDDYVNRHLGTTGATRYIHYEAAPVETFEERPQFSFGPMHQAHALLEFDEAFRRRVENDWKEALTLSRLVRTGLTGGALFLGLAVLLGYLRADNATRGFYTRRLRLGAAAVILALAAVIYFAARTVPWI